MKTAIVIMGFAILAFMVASCNTADKDDSFVKGAIQIADHQYRNLSEYSRGMDSLPRSVKENGEIHFTNAYDWTSGFFPGSLWYLYELTGDEFYRNEARHFTSLLERQQFDSTTHDTGFQMFCSYGNGYRLTENDQYRDVLIQSAYTLASRYSPITKSIKSWDWGNWSFPVIIDNMMNLELLYWAGSETGDTLLSHIASQHALTTMEHHFREDNSSYHVVDFDRDNGSVLSKITWQGMSDESAWSRGQAWGLYGYTMCYRESGEEVFLEKAEKIADYILGMLPEDKIPFWDFSLSSTENEPRDASAAAICASAFLELYTLTEKKEYKEIATEMLTVLSSDRYLAEKDSNNHFILKHSTGHKGFNSEVDVPLNYADYYYLEALIRLKNLA